MNIKELSDCLRKLAPIALTSALKVVLQQTDSIFFPLHDRKKLLGADYSKLFRKIRQVKINYEKLAAQRKEIEIRYEDIKPKIQQKADRSVEVKKPADQDKKAKNSQNQGEPSEIQTKMRKGLKVPRRPGRKSLSNISLPEESFDSIETGKPQQIGKNPEKEASIMVCQMFYLTSTVTPSFVTPLLKRVYEQLTSTKKDGEAGVATTRPGKSSQHALNRKIYEVHINKQMFTLRNYYATKDPEECAHELIKVLRSQRPLREKLPSFFRHRVLEDFTDSVECHIKFPLNQTFQKTIWKNLIRFEERSVREYFGDKITLYFAFANHFKDWLVYPALLAILYQILEFYYMNTPYYLKANETPAIAFKVGSIVLVVSITIFKNQFLSKWEQYERKYSRRYGLTNIEEAKTIRSRFEGRVARSVITDKLNDLTENSTKSQIQFALSMVWFLIIITLTMASCYTIVYLKRLFHKDYAEKDVPVPLIGMTILELLFNGTELARIMVFDRMFLSVVQSVVSWQNLKYVEDHEQQVIIYMCCFQFINKCCYMVLLTYDQFLVQVEHFPPNSEGIATFRVANSNCSHNSCYIEIGNFFMSYNIFEFVWTVVYDLGVKAVLRHLKRLNLTDQFKKGFNSLIGRTNKKKSKKNLNILNTSLPEENIEPEEKDKRKVTIDHIVSTYYQNPKKMYEEIDKEIEDQIVSLEDYNEVGDLDKSLWNYVKIVNNFTFIMLFGPIFSLSYSFVWLTCLVDFHLRREELLYSTKRPNPMTANSIGLWYDMVKFVSFVSVLTNSFYVAILVFQDLDSDKRLLLFLLLVVVLGIFDFLLRQWKGAPSFNFMKALSRLEFVQSLAFSSSGPTKGAKHKNSLVTDFKSFKHEINHDDDFWDSIAEKADDKLEKLEKRQEQSVYKSLEENLSKYIEHSKAQDPADALQSAVNMPTNRDFPNVDKATHFGQLFTQPRNESPKKQVKFSDQEEQVRALNTNQDVEKEQKKENSDENDE